MLVPAMKLASIVATLVLCVSRAAFADGLGDDEVTLKNGGSVRGTVVSVEPGTSVKILETGAEKPRVIPWMEVADVQKGKYAPATATNVQPGTAGQGYQEPNTAVVKPKPRPAAVQPQPVETGPRVHIDSPEPAQLKKFRGATYQQLGNYAITTVYVEDVCASPCDQNIPADPGAQYFVDGDFPSTGLFSLDGQGQAPTIKVKPGSIGGRVGGLLMISGGAAALAAGVTILVIDGINGDTYDDQFLKADGTWKTVPVEDATWQITGGLLTAGGAALLAGGVVTFVLSATHFQLNPVSSEGSASVSPWIGAPPPLAPTTNGSHGRMDSGALGGVRGSF
jgi:hypothetical protein